MIQDHPGDYLSPFIPQVCSDRELSCSSPHHFSYLAQHNQEGGISYDVTAVAMLSLFNSSGR